LATDLARAGVIVVSGLARGVDAAAHHGALDGGGRTVAVLGSGIDVIYPPEHDGLAAAIRRSGALVSEFRPGTPPRAAHFPQRNRIISGLARAVVVVEAGERSGSLITARFGLEQGREVMAVPGNVLSGRSHGCHALIKDGAKLVEHAVDILEELSLFLPALPPSVGPVDPLLLAMEPGEPYHVDALVGATGLDGAALLRRLLELELAGLVTRVDGGRFVRGAA
jgi:DNA processing protein